MGEPPDKTDYPAAKPDEAAVRAAAAEVMKGWALFRSPDIPGGATELVPNEYEDFVRHCVKAYLRCAAGGGSSLPDGSDA